jgi:hypothetical protein
VAPRFQWRSARSLHPYDGSGAGSADWPRGPTDRQSRHGTGRSSTRSAPGQSFERMSPDRQGRSGGAWPASRWPGGGFPKRSQFGSSAAFPNEANGPDQTNPMGVSGVSVETTGRDSLIGGFPKRSQFGPAAVFPNEANSVNVRGPGHDSHYWVAGVALSRASCASAGGAVNQWSHPRKTGDPSPGRGILEVERPLFYFTVDSSPGSSLF